MKQTEVRSFTESIRTLKTEVEIFPEIQSGEYDEIEIVIRIMTTSRRPVTIVRKFSSYDFSLEPLADWEKRKKQTSNNSDTDYPPTHDHGF